MTNHRTKGTTVTEKNEQTEQQLEARAEALEAEIESRTTPSMKQAEFATAASKRPADDQDDDGEISPTTRIQAAYASKRRS